MDTRRRSDSGERFGTSPSAAADASGDAEVDPGTRLVRLSDLQPVGSRGSGPSPVVIVTMVAIVVLAFVMGAGFKNMNAEPSPTRAPAAVATATQPATARPTATPRPTPLRTVVPVTPTPTDAHPWTWTRMDFQVNLGALPEQNMWAVGDHVLLLGQTYDNFDRTTFEIASINSGFGWDAYAVPSAIADIDGETVIDDHLWFMGLVPGIAAENDSWQLVGTQTGASWESLGPTDAFDHVAGPSAGKGNGFGFVGRVGDVWVVETYQDGESPKLYWSDDGRHWNVAKQPAIKGNVQIAGSAMFRDRMLVLGWSFIDFEHAESFILSSTDGRTWEQLDLGLQPGAGIGGLACNMDACVAAEDPREGAGTVRNLWVTHDGDSWEKVSIDLPSVDSGSPIRLIKPTNAGFIAIAGFTDTALLSDDGRTWRQIDGIMPAISHETLVNLAVAGDLVVGYGSSGSSDIPNALWRGSLKVMEAAP